MSYINEYFRAILPDNLTAKTGKCTLLMHYGFCDYSSIIHFWIEYDNKLCDIYYYLNNSKDDVPVVRNAYMKYKIMENTWWNRNMMAFNYTSQPLDTTLFKFAAKGNNIELTMTIELPAEVSTKQGLAVILFEEEQEQIL